MDLALTVVASNRGPAVFSPTPGGDLTAARGGGGLVSAISSVLRDSQARWMASALSEGDRTFAAANPRGAPVELDGDSYHLSYLALDRRDAQASYNTVANRTLWFLQHYLFDLARTPRFDAVWWEAWEAYRRVNAAFARALSEQAPVGGAVLIQDYHLSLAAMGLRAERDDVRIAHFTHSPWCAPDYFAMLPDRAARELLQGMLACDLVGFLTPRWADNFSACARVLLGAQEIPGGLRVGGRDVRVGVYPLGVDAPSLVERAQSPDVARHADMIRARIGDRALVVRVDRLELSKNLLRGLASYEAFLLTHPEWRGRVVHLIHAYPSRQDLPEYQLYAAEVEAAADAINERFVEGDWEPVVLDVSDDFPRSLAAMTIADVLVVNPVMDGMNLVAKEGSIVSRADTVLVLSRNAGAFPELEPAALAINPLDVVETAEAIARALNMGPEERRSRARTLRAAASAWPPSRWLTEQYADLCEGPRG
ncbi:MAG: trehalose-6-phosphate synthase [Actinomycetota bacterium]